MRTTRLMLAASGLATVALLASSAAANAAAAPKAINGPNITGHVAGYEISGDPHGHLVRFNEVRGTATFAPGSTSDAVWALQSTNNGGETYALRAHFVFQGHNEGAIGGGIASVSGWYLQAGVGFPHNAQNGTFDPTTVTWFAVDSMQAEAGDALFQVNTGGTVYGEVHQSTHTGVIAFVTGVSETNNSTLAKTFGGIFSTFNAPAVEGWNAAPSQLGLNSPQVQFSRVGVTEPAGSNVGGTAGTRITFDYFNVWQTLATAFGGAPTTTDPLALVTGPSFPVTSSSFGVVGGAL
jgi:hypothetical protein